MQRYTVMLLETGLAPGLPGVAPRQPGSTFPFWGTATLFDFVHSGLRELSEGACWVLAEQRDRASVASAMGRWGRSAARYREVNDGLEELRRLAGADRADVAVVSSLSYAALLDWAPLAEGASISSCLRARVDGTPLPLFLLPREQLVELLTQSAPTGDPAGPLAGLCASTLPRAVSAPLELSGRPLFWDNMMQLWDAHHHLREALGSSRGRKYIELLWSLPATEGEAVVEPSGHVKDSLVCPGARVGGFVEDSVIFPGAVVRKGAEVRQSIIMSGARIGAGATVANTLVLPCGPEVGVEADTIGAEAVVGDSRHVMHTRNDDYPRQIARGVTLIGMDAAVPPKLLVESGCYVGPGVAAALKGSKKLARGASVV